MTEKREATFVGELPGPGPGPWAMRRFKDVIILTSPVHPPMVLHEGKLEPLGLGSELGSPLPK